MAELTPVEITYLIRELDDNKKMMFHSQFAAARKDPGTGLILASLSYDRIWLGEVGLGIIKILTFSECGIWGLIDLFSAKSRCDDYNRRTANELVMALRLN